MATARQEVHRAGKAAVRDIAKGLVGRIIDIKATLISVAVYDSATQTSMDDYDLATKGAGSPLVEVIGSYGIESNAAPSVLYQDSSAGMGVNSRATNIWAPPSSPRVVHVRPSFETSHSSNISVGDWINLIPTGTGDNYTLGSIISHSDGSDMSPIARGPVPVMGSTTDATSAKEGA